MIMDNTPKVPGALSIIAEQLPKWWNDPGSEGLKGTVETMIPQDAIDLGLMVAGGPGGKLARKAGVALMGAGASTDAQAGNIIPAVLTGMKKFLPELMVDLRKGASRSELMQKYGMFPLTHNAVDVVEHLPTPGSARVLDKTLLARMSDPAFSNPQARAISLGELLNHPELYAKVPDLKGLTVAQLRGLRTAAAGEYSLKSPGSLLPKSGRHEPGADTGLEMIVTGANPFERHPITPHFADVTPLSGLERGDYSLLDHEVNHALQARARGSVTDGPWETRLHEVNASLGAQDIPTDTLIQQLDEVFPLGDFQGFNAQKFEAPNIGNSSQQALALQNLRGLPNLRQRMRDFTGYAEGGPVKPKGMEHTRSSGQDATTQPLTGSALKALVRGWMAGTAGLPGDLEGLARAGLHMGAAPDSWFAKNVSRDPALPTTEFYKDWLPGKQQGDELLNTLGSITGGMGATLPVKAAKGALSRIAAAAPGPMAGSRAAMRGVIKAPGGNWLSGSVEDALRKLQRSEALDNPEQARALNQFIDKQLTRYVQKDMATERDPIRALAERGVLHIDPTDYYLAEKRVHPSGESLQKLGQSPWAARWENISDNVLRNEPASDLLADRMMSTGDNPHLRQNPWLATVPPETRVNRVDRGYDVTQDLGFGHLMDELRNATNINSGLPAHLRLDPASLARVSVPQAVERVAKINDWRAAQKAAADQALANNAATVLHKDYPDKGFKWVELRTPPIETAPEGWSVQPSTLKEGFLDIVDPRGQRSFGGATEQAALEKLGVVHGRSALEDAIKYEGDTMNHCVGKYCDDVASGKSRIYSLRDAKGQPHTTIEVVPKGAVFSDVAKHIGPERADELLDQGVTLSEMIKGIPDFQYPQEIKQIKGKGNKAPNPEYLPYVQDFVKSGKWSDVGDLGNTGLRRATDAWNPNEEKLIKAAGIKFPTHATQQEIDAINQQVWPGVMGPAKPPGFADGGSVRALANAAIGSSNLAKQVGSSADAARSIAAGNGSLGDLNSLRQMASELGYTMPGLSQAMGLAATANAGYNMAKDPTGMNAAKFAAKVNPIAAQALSLYNMATDATPQDAANFIVGFHPLLRAYNGLADSFGFANIGQLAANLTMIGDPEAPAQLQDMFSNNPNSDALTRTANDIAQRTGADSMDALMGATGAFGTEPGYTGYYSGDRALGPPSGGFSMGSHSIGGGD